MREPEAGDTVEWKTRKRFRTFGYKARGTVEYIEGTRAKICIKWNGTQKGDTKFWKELTDLIVVTDDR